MGASASAKTVIPHLDVIFSRHGIPDVVKIDKKNKIKKTEVGEEGEYIPIATLSPPE